MLLSAEEFVDEKHAQKLELGPSVRARLTGKAGGSAAGGSPLLNPDERESRMLCSGASRGDRNA